MAEQALEVRLRQILALLARFGADADEERRLPGVVAGKARQMQALGHAQRRLIEGGGAVSRQGNRMLLLLRVAHRWGRFGEDVREAAVEIDLAARANQPSEVADARPEAAQHDERLERVGEETLPERPEHRLQRV